MKTVRKFVIVMLIGAAGIAVSAEQRRGEVVLVRPPSSPIRFAGPWRPEGAVNTRVVGTVLDVAQMPVAYARLQLRELKTGGIVGKTESNDRGEYEFTVVEPGLFVVEMLVKENQVLALSNAGLLARYQTLQTFIQLTGRWNFTSRSMSTPVPRSGFLGFGAARSMTSTTIALAADADIRPIDAGEPVSPQ